MKILITGVAGFVGKNLAKYYLKKNHQVTGIYRNKKPRFLKSKNLNLICLNLKKKNFLIKNDFFNVIVHCAAETPVTTKNSKSLYINNIKSIKNLLNNFNFEKFFFLSSMSVYGKIKEKKINENTKPIDICMYGKSKLDSEKILKNYSNLKRIKCMSLRLPGVVGRGSHGNFVSEIYKNVKKNKKINPNNPKTLFNNIVHVKKLYDFISKEVNFKNKTYYCVNLASKNIINVKDLVNYLKLSKRYDKSIKWMNNKKKGFVIDISKAKKIGYKPWSVKLSLKKFIGNI